jgi:hypothetical protein
LKKTFLLPNGFSTKLGRQIRLLPVPNFGVNICPFNYGLKVILFRNWLQPPTSSNWICLTPILSPRNPTLGHLFPKLKSPMAGQNQAAQVNSIPASFIRHYLFGFYLRFLPRFFSTGAFHRAFDSHWGQFDVLFPRSCGNLWPSRVYCSRIPMNSFQSGFI